MNILGYRISKRKRIIFYKIVDLILACMMCLSLLYGETALFMGIFVFWAAIAFGVIDLTHRRRWKKFIKNKYNKKPNN